MYSSELLVACLATGSKNKAILCCCKNTFRLQSLQYNMQRVVYEGKCLREGAMVMGQAWCGGDEVFSHGYKRGEERCFVNIFSLPISQNIEDYVTRSKKIFWQHFNVYFQILTCNFIFFWL